MPSNREGVDRSKIKVLATKTWQCVSSDTPHSPTTASPSVNPPSSIQVLKNPSDVDFINDSDFIVCDSDQHCIHLFSLKEGPAEEEGEGGGGGGGQEEWEDKYVSGDKVETIRQESSEEVGVQCYDHKVLLSEKVWPSCVVVTREGRVRVSDRKNKSVKTFDLSTEELVSEWKSDERMSPQGVAVCQGGQSIVTDSTNNCVWVLDEKGNLLRSFGSEGDLLHQFRLPFYACVDDKDNILVSDNMNYCVKSFDLRGEFLTRIGSGHLFGQRKFQSPYGVTYDSGNHEILVADHATNRIFTYDKQGTFLRYAVSGSECQSPCGIAINNNRLVVSLSNPENYNVKLFMLKEK